MKEGFFLVVVCVLIIGGIAIWLVNGGSLQLLNPAPVADASLSEGSGDGAKEATPPPQPVKPRASRRASVQAPVQPPPVVASDVPEVAPVAPIPPPVVKQFPSANQVAVGLERENVSEQYGQPSLATTTSDDGHIVETLVYARNRGREVTVIRIEDGKVLSAYSR